ncbi:MAG: ribonuclease HI family protein [Gemmataceae bacterium]|nr:ribonuclease HI family protein [Gemmataceae bacterium]
MSEDALTTVNIDGAARGNPGPAAFAFVIAQPGRQPVEEKGCLGHKTNNVAEYTALVKALARAAELGARRLLIKSDSELLVKQMNGEYRVKNEDLQELFQEAKELSRHFDSVRLQHVRRAENGDADRLCNEALDGVEGKKPAPAKTRERPKTASADRRDAIRADAVEALEAAAHAWAQGDARTPRPVDVWEQLWSILEDHGIIRAARGR